MRRRMMMMTWFWLREHSFECWARAVLCCGVLCSDFGYRCFSLQVMRDRTWRWSFSGFYCFLYSIATCKRKEFTVRRKYANVKVRGWVGYSHLSYATVVAGHPVTGYWYFMHDKTVPPLFSAHSTSQHCFFSLMGDAMPVGISDMTD